MNKVIPWLWAIVFCAVVVLGAMRYTPASIHTDIRALLPATESSASAEKILAHSAETSRDVWILVGMPTLDEAAEAANLFMSQTRERGLSVKSPSEAFDIQSLAKELSAYRNVLLTSEDKSFLNEATDEQLLRRSLSLLYRPVSTSLLPFQDDPLGTFENVLLQQSLPSRFQFTGPCVNLRQTIDGVRYCVLTIRSHQAMNATGSMPLTNVLREAENDVIKNYPNVRIHAAGVPLISEEVASNAANEASFIGLISTAAIVALVALFFASVTPLLITLAVLAVSLVFASASVMALFGEVHVLTIVFGATLLGICVDYVLHLLCAVSTGLSGPEAQTKLLRPLTLSLLTTGIGYLVMAVSPMPGLRQMAVFCIAGLFAAYLNVVFITARFLKPAQASASAQLFARFFAKLPLPQGSAKVCFVVLLLVISCIGCLQLKTQNELALLNRIPQSLLADAEFIGQALSPTSPGQLFVISASDTDAVLEKAQQLQTKLEALAEKGIIGRSLNPTAFLPSQSLQNEVRALLDTASSRALKLTTQALGTDFPTVSPINQQPLTLTAFKEFSADSLNRFWLTDTTLLVPLAGVTTHSLPHLQAIAASMEGVRFVNTTAEVAESLAHYRDSVFIALASALAVIGIILALGIRKHFMRFWLPTPLSILLTLGICGFAGIPFSLFTVLPLVLVVGLGIDYAIVLYSETNTIAAGNSVFLAATSTLFAFGLLAFSSTPALHWFGLTLAIAIGVVMFITTLLRPLRT